MTVFRCRECETVHDSFQKLADCCDPLTGEDDDPGAAPPLVADGGRPLDTAHDCLRYALMCAREDRVEDATEWLRLGFAGCSLDRRDDRLRADGGRTACDECGDAVDPEAFKVVGGRLYHFECAPDDEDGYTFEQIEVATDGGTRSRRAERATDRGQSSLREHVRSTDTLAGVADQDDECENGTVGCPGPDPNADVWPCFECFLAGVDASDQDADEILQDRSPRSLLEDDQEGSA